METKKPPSLTDQRSEFLERLPDLSKSWQPPKFHIQLEPEFLIAMIEEYYGWRYTEDHWIRFYSLSGISPNTSAYFLPDEIRAARRQGGEDERCMKEVVDHHLAVAMWPLIKAGNRPWGSLKTRIGDIVRRKSAGKPRNRADSSDLKHLWYWAIAHLFLEWHDSATNEYAKSLSPAEGPLVPCFLRGPQWFDMQCLNWWLDSEAICMSPDEIGLVWQVWHSDPLY